MSKYTTEVRFICENFVTKHYPEEDLYDISRVVDLSYSSLLSVETAIRMCYKPLKEEVTQHIYKIVPQIFLRNYTREICCETVGLWRLRLQSRLNEKLPYYADLFETLGMKYDAFKDTDYTTSRTDETGKTDTYEINETDTMNNTSNKVADNKVSNTIDRNGSSHSEEVGDNSTDSTDKYSDTPQGAVFQNDLEGGEYLTNARNVHTDYDIDETKDDAFDNHESHIKDEDIDETITNNGDVRRQGTDKRTIVNNGTETTTIIGKVSSQSYSSLMIEYRKSLANINEMFLNEFNDLFMLIY